MSDPIAYMIRNGQFGTDLEQKLFATTFGVLICLFDWRTRRRSEYFLVYAAGSTLWFLVELGLQLRGTRVMPLLQLFGAPMPVWAAALLRGTSEGGYVAVIGLLFGDRLLEKNTRARWGAIFALMMLAFIAGTLLQGVPAKAVGAAVASRRDVFAFPALPGIAVFLAIDALWLWRTDRESRRRGLAMVLVMIAIAGIWTAAEYVANTRWIEVGAPGRYRQAGPLLEFGVLAWDVVVEIALVYLPFFAIPNVLKRVTMGGIRPRRA